METIIAHTKIFDVVEKDEVAAGFKPVGINAPDWVMVIVEKNGQFLMVRQTRFGLMKEIEEFMCGTVENGEQPVMAAVRELKEETGYIVNPIQLVSLGKVAPNPGFMNNHMHIFYVDVNNGANTCDPNPGEHERLTLAWRDKSEVKRDVAKIHGDEECPAMKECAVYRYERHIQTIKA